MTNGVPILGQGISHTVGDPLYYILTQWFSPDGQGGPFPIEGYAPKLHGRPAPFSPAHLPHVQQLIKEALATQGVLGAQVVITFMWRYEAQGSALVDLHGGSSN
jgi:hypothetical protein